MTDFERPQVTPEGHTPEEPAPSELGKVGTPGAGMTPAAPHVADAHDADAHDADGHVDTHAATDDAHPEPRIGPIDWPAWGYAAVGALIGLLVAGMFYVATV